MATSRVFFITDVHGSTRCFKKFLNAAKFYNANVLVLGGDVTGKVLDSDCRARERDLQVHVTKGNELTLKNKADVDGPGRQGERLGTSTPSS